MSVLDIANCRDPKPYNHQVVGVEALVKWNDPATGRIHGGCFALFDEMGAGKSRQAVEAMQVLYDLGKIKRVLIVAPSDVRSVWFDDELGELKKFFWDRFNATISEFHAKTRRWTLGTEPGLQVMITNYEFIRSKARLIQLLPFCDKDTLVVFDESSAIKNHKSAQATACLQIRRKCGWVWMLNGTPVSNHNGDLFSQMNILDPRILGCTSYTHFCKRYAVMEPVLGRGGQALLSPRGFVIKTIAGWTNTDDLQKRIAPYVLRRLKEDCLDLPAKLPPIMMTVPLTSATWAVYKEMRDEMLVWLSNSTASTAPQAITKIMRLAQITSGFLGGVEDILLEDDGERDLLLEASGEGKVVQEIGREKLDAFLGWLSHRLEEDPNFKCIIWSRFVAELSRAIRETKSLYSDIPVGVIAGGYKKSDREFALRLLNPATAPAGPAIVFGNPQSGGLGLNMTAAHHMFRLSNDYSLFKRAQSEDRIHRPGQTKPTTYIDLIAIGPQGQKTVDHAILGALIKKHDLSENTTSSWVSILAES